MSKEAKFCSCCKETKPTTDFYKQQTNQCKQCRNAVIAKWRSANREKLLEQARAANVIWYENNPAPVPEAHEQEPVAWRVRCTEPQREWVLMYKRPTTELQFSNMEIQPLYTSPPAQQEPLQSIPSLTTVLAHLERLLPSEVYNGMVDVIENEFQRKQQPAPVQQAPVAIVRTWHKNGDQHAELDDWGLALALLPDGKHELYPSPPAQRTWVGLTDEEIAQGNKESWVTEQAWQSAVWWAEAKLKEKNT